GLQTSLIADFRRQTTDKAIRWRRGFSISTLPLETDAMSRLSRCHTFARDEMGVYHAFNRTVRRSYLHGVDPLTGIDYGYRRERFRQRMQFLSQHFCIDVLAFAIMSSHWHSVLRNRPDQVRALSDRQVAVRWLS